MFTAKAADLSKALSLILASAERKTTIPILAFTLFESDGETVKATGTDIDSFVSLCVPASKVESGAFCVPTSQLFDLASLMEGDVSLTVENQVVVRSEKSTYRLPKDEKSNFPQIEHATESNGRIDGKLLGAMIKAAAIAVSTNPNELDFPKTLLLTADGQQLQIVGTDRHRLTVTSTPYKHELSAVLPLRAALLLAAFAEQSESAELFCSNNLLTLKTSNGEAGARLSTTPWPNWKPLIPKEGKHSIALSAESLTPLIKRATLATNSELRGLKFTLGKSGAVITASAHDKGSGEEFLPMDCASLNGDELIIGVPGRQLLDLFKVCKEATWEIKDSLSQMSFKPKENLPFDFQYIVMPIRVDKL